MKNLFQLSSYHFDLPPELVVQYPAEPRDSSRLMLVNRSTGKITEMVFRELADFLESGDSLVFNNTKVIPARLLGNRPTGGEAEILLVRKNDDRSWNVLAKPGRKLPEGATVIFGPDFFCEILEVYSDGSRRALFHHEGDFYTILHKYGLMPLPQYIKRSADSSFDNERYQTVYASRPGAVAAPTAGLHFTDQLIDRLAKKHVDMTQVTLHVGLGTFRPVQTEDIRCHIMHPEQYFISEETATKLNARAASKKQICVGTTSCRALESAANNEGKVKAGEFDTNIFIYSGYQFKYVNSLLTNFHLPGSSLLMLVSAFAGYELIMEAYAKAVERKFRFFSYGDAMLIV